jgi:hypothetical protein
MKPMKTILALALSGLMMSAFAQMGPGANPDPGSGPYMGAMGDGGYMQPEQMRERMGARMAERAKELHDKLKLNADQDAAWKAMVAAWKPPTDQKRLDIAEMEKLTAPERMEKIMERLKQHEETFGMRLEAVKTFYNKLSPEQKKTFDQETLDNWKKRNEHRRNAKRGPRPQAK